MTYSNSPLVSYTRLSPNNSGTRTHTIDRITPHHVVGLASVEGLGALFAESSRKASSNYGIGSDGRVALYVPESSRSMASSSWDNDQRAVTIECADEATWPYAFSDVVYSRLIELCADICRRNGKRKLLWIEDRVEALAYTPKADEMLLTVHRWFLATLCPGQWMMQHMGDLARQVTAELEKDPPANGQNEDVSTLDTSDYKLPLRTLKRGDRGDEVKAAQILLIGRGFGCGPCGADGDFGTGTQGAVDRFQAAKGIIESGIGPLTMAKLHGL